MRIPIKIPQIHLIIFWIYPPSQCWDKAAIISIPFYLELVTQILHPPNSNVSWCVRAFVAAARGQIDGRVPRGEEEGREGGGSGVPILLLPTLHLAVTDQEWAEKDKKGNVRCYGSW